MSCSKLVNKLLYNLLLLKHRQSALDNNLNKLYKAAEPLDPPSCGHGDQGFGVPFIVMVRLGRYPSSSFRLRRLCDQMVDTIPYLLLDTYLNGIPDSFFYGYIRVNWKIPSKWVSFPTKRTSADTYQEAKYHL